MNAEQISMIGDVVHTDAGERAIVPGMIVGWDGDQPRVRLNRDPSIGSRVGAQLVMACHLYEGDLLESGLPVSEREDKEVLCWAPDLILGASLTDEEVALLKEIGDREFGKETDDDASGSSVEDTGAVDDGGAGGDGADSSSSAVAEVQSESGDADKEVTGLSDEGGESSGVSEDTQPGDADHREPDTLDSNDAEEDADVIASV